MNTPAETEKARRRANSARFEAGKTLAYRTLQHPIYDGNGVWREATRDELETPIERRVRELEDRITALEARTS